MTKRFCCCTEGCTIETDDFSDSGTLVTKWDIRYGTWVISDNKLETEDTEAEIVLQATHPDTIRHHILLTSIWFTALGDKAQIRFGTDFIFELEFGTASSAILGTSFSSGVAPCSTVRLYQYGNLVAEEKHLRYWNGSSLLVGYDEEKGIFWANVSGRIGLKEEDYLPQIYFDIWYDGFYCLPDLFNEWSPDILNLYSFFQPWVITTGPFNWVDDCYECFKTYASYPNNPGAFSSNQFSSFAFSKSLSIGNIKTSPFVLGTGNIVTGKISFGHVIYLRGKTSILNQCPDMCTDEEDEEKYKCVISPAPCAPGGISNLSDSDLFCHIYQIKSGIWNSVSYSSTDLCSYLQTSDANALIEYEREQSLDKDAGAVIIDGVAHIDNVGDGIRIYLDYLDTSNSHYVDFIAGTDGGINAQIKIYKNGTLINSVTNTFYSDTSGGVAGFGFKWQVCASKNPDNTGYDRISGIIFNNWSAGEPWNIVCNTQTILNGYRKTAIGSIDTLTGAVAIYGGTVRENSDDCFTCVHSECIYCPDEDSPENGFIFTIGNITPAYGENVPWNCLETNGSYLVPAYWNSFGGLPTRSCWGRNRFNVHYDTNGFPIGIIDIEYHIFGLTAAEKLIHGPNAWILYGHIYFEEHWPYWPRLNRYSFKNYISGTTSCRNVEDLDLNILDNRQEHWGPCEGWESIILKVSSY